MPKKRRPTSDAVEILHREFFEGKPEMIAMLEAEEAKVEVSQLIYNLRTEAGLSQRELAKRVGTTASVICRLEDADYEGNTLAMIRRIATALNRRLELRAVPIKTAPAKTR